MPVYTDVTVPKLLQFTALSSKPFHCVFFSSIPLSSCLSPWLKLLLCLREGAEGDSSLHLAALSLPLLFFLRERAGLSVVWTYSGSSSSIVCMQGSLKSSLVNSSYTLLAWYFILHKREFSDSCAKMHDQCLYL